MIIAAVVVLVLSVLMIMALYRVDTGPLIYGVVVGVVVGGIASLFVSTEVASGIAVSIGAFVAWRTWG